MLVCIKVGDDGFKLSANHQSTNQDGKSESFSDRFENIVNIWEFKNYGLGVKATWLLLIVL